MLLSSSPDPLFCIVSNVNLPARLWKDGNGDATSGITTVDGVDCMEATVLLDIRCDLGEGIMYDDDKDQLLWTDINDQKFYALSLPEKNDLDMASSSETIPGKLIQVALPKMLCSFAMRSKGKEGFLCAFEDGFQLCRLLPSSFSKNPMSSLSLLDPSPGATTKLTIEDWMLSGPSVGEAVNPARRPTRLNDGRCDPTGKRFICGGYFGEDPNMFMKVFKCEATTIAKDKSEIVLLSHSPIYDNIQVTNSICFHGKDIMYMANSPKQTIYRFPYNCETGTLDRSAEQVFHKTPQGVPDGSCTDAEGYVWNAVWRSGAGPSFVHRLHPETGQVVFRVLIPPAHGTSQVTCCCFGGPNFDILFISSAAEQRDLQKEPFAGSVYAVKVPFQGKPEVRFAY
ncbi:hypothetical protein ACA910_015050 [Epithemia clementina (nom. ined.)]